MRTALPHDVIRPTRSIGVRALQLSYAAQLSDPHEIVDIVLSRIHGGPAAVWISRWSDAELHARAEQLQQLRSAAGGDLTALPLFGIPCAVKDNIDMAGLPTTAGCPAFSYRPSVDAHSVRRLLDAGAIVVGKTNLDQFATGLTGTRSPYGVCHSVFGDGLISGGSSSGSAVAVAAGMVSFALGTDTAGSGRVPAAMNGIVGVKPTRGLVSIAGVVPACRSLDCVSVFSTDVADASAVLAVIEGQDPADCWSRPRPPVAPPGGSGGRRIALPAGAELDFCGDDAMAEAFHTAAARVEQLATSTVTTPIAPLLEAGSLLYDGPWVAERLAGLESFLDTHPDGVLPLTRRVIERGRDYDAVATFRARHRLQELRAWTAALWQRADLLVLPTIPTTFTVDEISEQPIARNAVLGRFTQFTNLLDLAAVTIPAGQTRDGRPASVSLFSKAFSEPLLLAAAVELAEY